MIFLARVGTMSDSARRNDSVLFFILLSFLKNILEVQGKDTIYNAMIKQLILAMSPRAMNLMLITEIVKGLAKKDMLLISPSH